jgi:hypothetical protein
LQAAGRADLIGSKPHQLVPPERGQGALSIHHQRKRPGAQPAGRLGRRGAGMPPKGR